MKVEYLENELVIYPEDERDKQYFKNVLETQNKRLFVSIKKKEKMFETVDMISIAPYNQEYVKKRKK